MTVGMEGIIPGAGPSDMLPPETPDASSGSSATPPPQQQPAPQQQPQTPPPQADRGVQPGDVIDWDNLTERDKAIYAHGAYALLTRAKEAGVPIDISPDGVPVRAQEHAPPPKREKAASPKDAETAFFADIDAKIDTSLGKAKTVNEIAYAMKEAVRDVVGKGFGIANTVAEQKTAKLYEAEYNRNKQDFFRQHPDLKGAEPALERLLRGQFTIDDILDVADTRASARENRIKKEIEEAQVSQRAFGQGYMEYAEGRGGAPSGTGSSGKDLAKLMDDIVDAERRGDKATRNKLMAERWLANKHRG